MAMLHCPGNTYLTGAGQTQCHLNAIEPRSFRNLTYIKVIEAELVSKNHLREPHQRNVRGRMENE